jgi:hypothetical protein
MRVVEWFYINFALFSSFLSASCIEPLGWSQGTCVLLFLVIKLYFYSAPLHKRKKFGNPFFSNQPVACLADASLRDFLFLKTAGSIDSGMIGLP